MNICSFCKNKVINKGLTLVEIMITMSVMSIIAVTALALCENTLKLEKEFELKTTLRTVRNAIDRYYEYSHKIMPDAQEPKKYPKNIEELVQKKYLRKMPVDPFTGKSDFRIISSTDEPDSETLVFEGETNGENLYDLKSRSDYEAIDGGRISKW